MSSGEVRKVSDQDIQLVQNLVERCLHLYKNKKEVMDILLVQAKIEHGFTELVWQRLEKQNPEFFKAYYVCLKVKDQINIFNQLLERQVKVMNRMGQIGVAFLPISNGSHSSMHQAPFFVPENTGILSRPENMHGSVVTSSMFLNDGPSVQDHMQSIDGTLIHAGGMDISPNMHSPQNSHIGLLHGMNGVVIKSDPGYADSSAFAFSGEGNIMGMPPPVGDMAIPSLGNVDTNSQSLNGSLLDTEASSFGFSGQIPRNFSLSDLTAGFSQCSEILETYSRSPFLGADVGEFLSSPVRECEGEDRRLDTISEGLSYDEFCSD